MPTGQPALQRAARRPWLAAVVRRRPGWTALVLLVATALGLRLWWGWRVEKQLEAQQAEIRRRGEPLQASDRKIDPLPDSQNAWVLIGQAARLHNALSPAQTSLLYYPDYPPFGPAWEKAARASETANAAVFPLARQARALPRARFGSVWAVLGGLNIARGLSNTLGDGALYRHINGDDVEAVERLRDLLHIATLLNQDDTAVAQLVGMGINALGFNRAQVIAPGLRVTDDTRQPVRGLIADLLDERPATDGYRRSFVERRLGAIDSERQISAGTWVIRPLAEQEMVRIDAEAAVYAAVARAGDAESARRLLAGAREKAPAADGPTPFGAGGRIEPRLPRYSRWFETDRHPERYVEMWFRSLGERRVTAVSLAAQLYRADHGRWPARLEELVPAYLPALPADPFHSDGRPVGYLVMKGALPDGSDRPLVYYDAGATDHVAIDREPIYGWQPDQRADGTASHRDTRQYRDLARWLPAKRRFDASQASRPEAVGDHPDQPDAPGDDAQKNNDPKE